MPSRVHKQIMDELQLRVQTSSISILPTRVKVQRLPRTRKEIEAHPAIYIGPGGDDHSVPWNSENEVNKRYPVEFMIVKTINRDYATGMDDELDWRSTIMRLAAQFPFVNVSDAIEVWNYEILSTPIYDDELLDRLYVVSGIAVEYWTREVRVS